jgi:hypothetical protein
MLFAAPVATMSSMNTPSPAPTAARPSHLTLEPTSHGRAVSLLARARHLRTQSQQVNSVLATAYLRRSAELSLEAWLLTIHGAPTTIDEFTTVAA